MEVKTFKTNWRYLSYQLHHYIFDITLIISSVMSVCWYRKYHSVRPNNITRWDQMKNIWIIDKPKYQRIIKSIFTSSNWLVILKFYHNGSWHRIKIQVSVHTCFQTRSPNVPKIVVSVIMMWSFWFLANLDDFFSGFLDVTCIHVSLKSLFYCYYNMYNKNTKWWHRQ